MGFNLSLVCVLVLAFFGKALPAVFYIDVPKVITIYGGGAILEFKSNFSAHKELIFKSIFVDVNGVTVAAGGENTFQPQPVEQFGTRLNAFVYEDKSANLRIFNLHLTSLNFDDNVNFVGTVIYVDISKPKVYVSTTVAIESVVLGGPHACGEDLQTTSDVTAPGPSTIGVVLCGKPIPSVVWTNDGDALMTTSSTEISLCKYNFTVTFPTVESRMCGMNIDFVAEGNSGIDISGKTKLNVIFEPSVTLDFNYRLNSTCIKLAWTSSNIGSCAGLMYHFQYMNADGVAMATSNHSYPVSEYIHCTDDVTTIKDTRMQASFSGKSSGWTKQDVSLTIPVQPTEPAVRVERQTGGNDWETGAIIGGVLGGLFLILIIILIIWCFCCYLCACCYRNKKKRKEQEASGGVSTTNALGFQYKKHSKKKAKKEKANIDNNVVIVGDPAVVYSIVQKSKDGKDNLDFFDPKEFGLVSDEPPLKSQYNHVTYDNDVKDSDDEFSNRPSILI